MNGFDKFLISIFELVAHGKIFPEHIIFENTGFNVFSFDTMINNIKKRTINIRVCIKDRNSELFKITTKSLAMITMFPHNKDDTVYQYTNITKEELKKELEKLWGKPVDSNEYTLILNQ
jgi:hypothetical protein